MLAATAVARAQPAAARLFSTTVRVNGAAVAVLGGAGGIGQPLSLLMKQSPLVSDLRVYDLANSVGVAADLSHINTGAKVRGFAGKEQLADAVRGADVIIIPAGVPRKPNMTRDDLFNTNASIVASLAAVCAKEAPKAQMLIISNPVNSTVPIVAEIYKRVGAYDPSRLFGVTTLDVTRARTFVGDLKKVDPVTLKVPVIGGHAGITILPLLSQNSAKVTFTEEEIAALTHRIQFGGDEVVKAKAGTGSATLSMAYAGAEMATSVIRALNGEQGVVECAFVQSSVIPGLPFFSTQVELGRNGVSKIRDTGSLTAFEAKKLEELKAELKASIDKGVAFGTSFAL